MIQKQKNYPQNNCMKIILLHILLISALAMVNVKAEIVLMEQEPMILAGIWIKENLKMESLKVM